MTANNLPFDTILADSDQFDALLDEANDPATPAERLRQIASQAKKRWAAELRGTVGNDPPPAIIAGRCWALIIDVAANPNIAMSTMAWLADITPVYILDNPVLPLVILTNDWSGWDNVAFRHLRREAYQSGHPLCPVLAQICWHEWRIYRATPICEDRRCAVCFPHRAQEHLDIWQLRRRGSSS